MKQSIFCEHIAYCFAELHTAQHNRKKTSPLAQVIEQWTENPKAAGLIPAGRQLFRIACL